MKYFIVLLALILCGCDPSGSEITHTYSVMPEGLKDCKIYTISNGGREVTVVRCPNSSTSTQYTVRRGKTNASVYTVVIDGVEYERKQK